MTDAIKFRGYPIAASLFTLCITTAVWAGSGHGDEHGAHGSVSNPVGQPGNAQAAQRTVDVTLSDNYFEPEQIDVKPGETIRFRLSNQGSLVHQFSLGTPQMHENSQDDMQMMVAHGVIQGGTLNRKAMAMDMGNGQTMDHQAPNSLLLAPGESKELIWQFTQATNLEFACNVPGHYQAGMVGEIQFK